MNKMPIIHFYHIDHMNITKRQQLIGLLFVTSNILFRQYLDILDIFKQFCFHVPMQHYLHVTIVIQAQVYLMNTSILYPTCIKCMIPSPSSEVLCSPVPHNTSRQYIGVMHCLWTLTTRTKTSFTKNGCPITLVHLIST